MLTALNHINYNNQISGKNNLNVLNEKNVKTFKDLVVEAAKVYKNNIFARYPRGDTLEDMTFEQMGQLCQSYSYWLNGQEKEEESRAIHVGILGRNSINYLLIYISAIFSGNVTIPLDPNLYINALAYCVNHGDVDIIFYDSEYQSQINDLKAKCPQVKKYILIDQSHSHDPEIACLDHILEENKSKTMINTIEPNDDALIIFTSGTTGNKKGVVFTHDNLVDKTFSTIEDVYDSQEIYLNVLPLHHVASTGDFLMTLRFGFLLTFNSNIADLLDNLTLYQPTALRIVPLIVKNLLNQFYIEKNNHPEMSDQAVKTKVFGKNFSKIMCGGSYLPPEVISDYHQIGIKVGQLYGSTETAGNCSITDYNLEKRASIGIIAPNTQVRIQNGEIQVKSRSVMKGYYKEPEKTEESFTSDGWLRTGDLGFVDEDNYLYFKGRVKNLIILGNGENVAPEVIENLFNNDSLIQEIMVYGDDDNICAIVYPNFDYAESNGIAREDIKSRVWNIIDNKNKELASYEKIVKLTLTNEPFPKTASKKIIRNETLEKVRNMEKKSDNTTTTLLLPTTDTQKKIYECVWCVPLWEIMKLELIVIYTSLETVINKYVEERKETSVDLSVRETYPVGPSLMPSLFAFKGNPVGNIPMLYRLHQAHDLLKLKQSIEKALDIHVELKIKIYPNHEGVYWYHRMDDRKIDIPITKLTDKEWEEKKKTLVIPYQFTEDDSVFRIGIYETESQNYLFIDISHFVGDGISFNIFMSEGPMVYDGEIQNLSIQGRPFVRRDAKIDAVPREFGSIEGVFEKISVEKFTEFCKKNSITENTVLILAGSLALSLYENKKEVALVVPNNGRDNDLWNRVIGFLIKLYSFKFDLDGDESLLHAINRASKKLMISKSNDYNCLDANPLFFKYQDSMFSSKFFGNLPLIVEKLMAGGSDVETDFVIHKDLVKNCYYYNFIYWKSVFDAEQITLFIHLVENIIVSIINGTEKVGDLYHQIPKEYITSSHAMPIETVNEAIGQEYFTSDHGKNHGRVNVHIVNQYSQHQIVGGWGDLFVEESSTVTFTPEDVIDNPFGKGKLYKTGFTGRILGDGSINILENDCRLMSFGLCFCPVAKNINVVEKLLNSYDGITKCTIEAKYIEHEFKIFAHIFGEKEPDMAVLNDYLASKLNDTKLVPHEIIFHENISKILISLI
ncbi:hypothetical protein PIROE2DRAFT_16080 [Piromyces sp. E2]|nr:hypothetical protein PIROE2DRAFT_16080 [Piromyces sp. E2]|eukprot:OUM58602.1 hypothetical protein PIROE2DRAFT_16080 [Piromyces sp. E2]